MFSKVALLFVASMAACIAASPLPGNQGGQCNTGTIQCCNSAHESNSEDMKSVMGLLGVQVQNLKTKIGFQCSPVSGVGIGTGSKCEQAPMCCSNNNYNGLVVVGCTMINLGL